MDNGCESPSEANVLAGAGRLLWRYERTNTLNSHGAVPGGTVSEPANYELLDIVKENPKLHDSAKWSFAKKSSVSGWRASPMAFCHYVLSRSDRENAAIFFGRMVSGAHLDEGDAILRLRNRMAFQGQDGSKKIGSVEYVALVFKAWNCFKKNEKPGTLRWKTNESFPKPE
jgi:hypothetical protein